MNQKISRRHFIRGSTLSGATLLAASAAAPVFAAQDANPGPARNRAPGASAATIENELISIALDSRSGDIIGLRNNRSGREYIAATHWAKAFRLNVPLPGRITGFNADYSANSLDSWQQSDCSIARERSGNSQSLRVSYPALASEAGTFPIGLIYTITLEDEADQAKLQVQIENRSQYLIREVFFPWISGVGRSKIESPTPLPRPA